MAAVLFLVEAWFWDQAVALGHWIVGLLPWQAFKDAVARLIDRLPPYGALLLFLIPLAVIEPLKIVALDQIARGHFFSGVMTFVLLKFVGLGLVAFVFDLTRDKLLTIGWFARFYAWVVKWRDRAHDFIEPYKAAARALVADVKARLGELRRSLGWPAGKGGFPEMLARVKARVRKSQG
ncbi:hypothetical protein [uncultured Rhodoblastus sp.]|uniref:hypothetical protein n=1 Tax=uncultured Rhodoblastus sp. TaxID=543037 RepID=UPI0025F353C6|nr:hypothetical protein [uncultured Rhodoblastus sp.]